MGQGTAEFVAAGVPALAVALLMYILFCVCRRRYPDIYEPRTRKVLPELERPSEPTPPGLLQWIWPLLRLRLDDLAQNSGADAAACIVFQGTMAAVFLLLSAISCAILLPLYATADGGFSQFDRLTLTNVQSPGSWRYWIIAIVCWMASLISYLAIYVGVNLVSSFRVSEEKRLCNFQHQVVVVANIPKGSRSAEAVSDYFESRYPGSVLYAQPIKDMGKSHEALYAKYEQSWRALKRTEALERLKPEEKQMVKDGCLGLCGKKVEAIPYYKGQCDEYREQLQQGIDQYGGIEGWSTAFVAFNRLSAASHALATLRPGREWGCSASPHPREVYWSNMRKGRSGVTKLALASSACLLVATVVIVFMPVLAFAQSVCNLDELSRSVEFLHWVRGLPAAVRGLLQGLLPVLVVSVLNALVLPIMELLADLSGVESYKAYHRRVLWFFFTHLLLNCFFIIVCSSSIMNTITDIINDPGSVAKLLGESLPKVSTFFMLYTMTQALGGASGKLALLPKVIVGRLTIRFLAKTDFEKEEAVEPAFCEFRVGASYATDLFICVICMSYSMIAPLASLFGLLYFVLNIMSSKYLMNYFYKTQFNSSGALAVSGFRGACIGMMIGQLVMVFALALKRSPAAGLVAPSALVSLVIAAMMPHCEPGATAAQEGPLPKLVEALEEAGFCLEARRRLEEAQAAHHWQQPSYSPNFEDPVHDRFNWVAREIADKGDARASSSLEAGEQKVGSRGRPEGDPEDAAGASLGTAIESFGSAGATKRKS